MLDLSKIDKLDISSSADVSQLGRMIDDVYYGSYQAYFERLGFIWEECIRFYEGDQHIYYNEITRRYEVIPQTKYNKYIPRPTTNLILPIVQTVTAILTRHKPTAFISPNSTDSRDINAAKLAERILDAKWELDEEQIKLIKAAKILLLTGTVFRKDYWDINKGGVKQVELDGEIYNVNVGDNAVEIIDPFRMMVDLQDQSWYIETQVKPLYWIKQQFGKVGDGYTGLAEKVMEDRNLSLMMSLWNRLRSSTSQGLTAEAVPLRGCAIVKECYIRPTPKYPKGLLIISAGGKVLYINESPYYDPKVEDSWHPYTVCKWEEVPFRYHGLSLVENLVPLQKRLNSIDSLIILNRMQMVSPQWLVPSGCGVPEGYLNGAPGLCIPYNPVGANGARPEKLPGIGLPPDVYREREDTIVRMHNIAGDNEILQGINPPGVSTATGLSMLLEQSFSKFAPFVQQWEKFIEKGQQKKLLLIARKYREPRPAFIALLKSMNRDNLDIEITDFVGADLRDNINVRIEAGSSLPRSKIMEQQTYREMAQMGLFGPLDPMSNPFGNQQFLEKFGIEPIATNINADVKRARWIISVLTSINKGEDVEWPPILPFDDLNIHLQVLTDAMKAPNFKDERGAFQRRYNELMALIQQRNLSQQLMQGNVVAPALIPQGAGMAGGIEETNPANIIPEGVA